MDAKLVMKDDLVSLTYFVHVKEVRGQNELLVKDTQTGGEFVIRGKELIESCLSASQHTSTKKVTKTELAEKLSTSLNVPLTVCFDKSDGSERVLTGRVTSSEPLLGRSHALDLNVVSGSPLRLVDHRTLKWLIVEGVKYELKK